MIYVGITGWGDHESLYPGKIASKDKLKIYSRHFPIVEVDASFYAVQPIRNYQRWVADTPEDFGFIIKPQQSITGHKKEEKTVAGIKEEVAKFLRSIEPVTDAGKLKAVLVQFPPWFDCKEKNVTYLRFLKEQMKDIPCALEFRNQTWFSQAYLPETLKLMKQDGWIHSIVDEPQARVGSAPTILEATNKLSTIVRFHGRNVYGWNRNGNENWRKVRFLYRYNQDELLDWKEKVQVLTKQSEEICLLFNNNSGGDAADNAKEMMKILGIDYGEEMPTQLELF